MKIFGYILGTVRVLILVVTMALYLLLYAVATIFIKSTPARAFWLRRQWVKLFFLVTNFKYEVEYAEENPPKAALYISNHRSFSDPVIFARFIDAYVIAKAEVADLPVLSSGAKVTGIIYVKREDKSSRTAARETMLQTIQSGHSVLVYAEGTTSDEASTLPLKMGTFIEAAKHGFPIVPIAIIYNDRRHHWVGGSIAKQYFKQFGRWRTRAKMAVGPAMSDTDFEQLHHRCQSWIRERVLEG